MQAIGWAQPPASRPTTREIDLLWIKGWNQDPRQPGAVSAAKQKRRAEALLVVLECSDLASDQKRARMDADQAVP